MCNCSVSLYLRAQRCGASPMSDKRVSAGGSEAPFHQGKLTSYWICSLAVVGTWGCHLSESEGHQAQAWCQLEDSSWSFAMEAREVEEKLK